MASRDEYPVLRMSGKGSYCTSFTFSQDGKYAIFGTSGRTIFVYDTHGKFTSMCSGHLDLVSYVGALSGNQFLSASHDGSVTIWQPEGSQIAKLRKRSDQPRQVVRTCAVSENRTWLAVGLDSGDILAYYVADIDEIEDNIPKILKGHSSWIHKMHFVDDSLLLSVSDDGRLILWELGAGEDEDEDTEDMPMEPREEELMVTPKIVFEGHEEYICGFDVFPSNRMVATASGDGTVRVWTWNDMFEGTQLHVFTGDGIVKDVAFSNDGTHVVFGTSAGTLCVGNVMDGSVCVQRRAHEDRIMTCCFLPWNGEDYIISGGMDKVLICWKLNDGAFVRIREHAHNGGVFRVFFYEHGSKNFLVSLALDTCVRLFRLGQFFDQSKELKECSC